MAKQKFKITNWSAYNKVLRQRGSLTVWLDESAITDLAQQRQTQSWTDWCITRKEWFCRVNLREKTASSGKRRKTG
jgi:hypothetical protein